MSDSPPTPLASHHHPPGGLADAASAAAVRRTVYALLIVLAAGNVAGRLMNTVYFYEPWSGRWPQARPMAFPTLSSNDRSRWATMRALVDEGTYEVGYGELDQQAERYRKHGILAEHGFSGVDYVLRPEDKRFFSSKPPLLATLMAGPYAVLKGVTGWSLNGELLAALDADLASELQSGTLSEPLRDALAAQGLEAEENADVTTWEPAARWLVNDRHHAYIIRKEDGALHVYRSRLEEVIRTLLLLYNVVPMILYLAVLGTLAERYGTTDWGRLFVVAAAALGTLITTFGVTLNNHLPAAFAALFAVYFLLEVLDRGRREWWVFALAGLLCGLLVACELPGGAFALGAFLVLLQAAPRQTLTAFLPAIALVAAAYLLTNYLAVGDVRPVYLYSGVDDPGHPDYDWYHYAGSHWAPENIAGIDAADEPKHIYAMHAAVGHHGILSHSPIFLLSLWGTLLAWKRSRGLRTLALLTAVCTVVVFAFYVIRTNNYGGNTSGFRWMIWLIPLWLVVMLPAADRMGACWKGRSCSLLLLAVSVLSVSFPTWNPWRPNWPFRLLEYLKLIDY